MATIKDIARLAGVSQGTVSNVLNNKGNVSSDKIQQVERAARELGYNTNLQARRLRGETARHVAIVLPDVTTSVYAAFYESLSGFLGAQGYETSLHLSGGSPDTEGACYRQALSYRPWALVMASCTPQPQALYSGDGAHMVFLDVPGGKGGYASYWFSYTRIAQELAASLPVGGRALLFCDNESIPFDRALAAALTPLLGTRLALLRCDGHQMAGKAFDALAAGADVVWATNSHRANALRDAQALGVGEGTPVVWIGETRAAPRLGRRAYELDYRHMARCIAEDIEAPAHRELAPDGLRFAAALPAMATGTDLTLMTLANPTTTALERLAPYLEKRTGIRLKTVALPYDELWGALSTASTEHCDLVRMDMVWRDALEERLCLPLSEVPGAQRLAHSFAPEIFSAFNRGRAGGYTLPLDPTTQLLFYREDLFSDTKLGRLYFEATRQPLQPPADYESYNRIARFFTRELNPYSPVPFGTTLTYGSAAVAACDFIPRFGGRALLAGGRLDLADGKMQAALQSYVEAKPYAPPDVSYWWGQSLESFAAGRCAMTVVFINHASPIINQPGSRVIGKVGAAPVPGGAPLMGGGCVGITRHSQKHSEAVAFLEWLYSGEVANLLTLLGGLSPCQPVYSSEEVYALYPWLHGLPRQYGHARRGAGAGAGLDDYRFEQILGRAVRDAAMGVAPPAQALAVAAARIETELNG